jgi:hypothetical protein
MRPNLQLTVLPSCLLLLLLLGFLHLAVTALALLYTCASADLQPAFTPCPVGVLDLIVASLATLAC